MGVIAMLNTGAVVGRVDLARKLVAVFIATLVLMGMSMAGQSQNANAWLWWGAGHCLYYMNGNMTTYESMAASVRVNCGGGWR